MTSCTIPTADASPTPWYRQRWPWLLMAGPAIVVVAAITTAWIAASGADPLLADDYYRRGLLVNKRLAVEPRAVDPATGAVLRFGSDGSVGVELTGVSDRAALPSVLRLTVARPSGRSAGAVATLVRGADGGYAGRVGAPQAGRWIVTLEAGNWRLPTTLVAGPQSVVRLGAADVGG